MTTSLAMLFWPVLVVVGLLIWYALRNKGDVSAEIAHGNSHFKLEAKDKRVIPERSKLLIEAGSDSETKETETSKLTIR